MEQDFIPSRSENLGKILASQRELSEKSIVKTAAYLGVPPEEIIKFENGEVSPSLPQLESLSLFYKVPVNDLLMAEKAYEQTVRVDPVKIPAIISLRTRIIAAMVNKARTEQNRSQDELAADLDVDLPTLEEYESGRTQIPIPALEKLCATLGLPIKSLFSEMSRTAPETVEEKIIAVSPETELRENETPISTESLNLPPEISEFVKDHSNLPYLELAKRLSEMDAAKLRTIAESLLEITY